MTPKVIPQEDLVEFRIVSGPYCILKISGILCLFPDSKTIRTTETGWTIEVHPDDWPVVMERFNAIYRRNSTDQENPA